MILMRHFYGSITLLINLISQKNELLELLLQSRVVGSSRACSRPLPGSVPSTDPTLQRQNWAILGKPWERFLLLLVGGAGGDGSRGAGVVVGTGPFP